MIVQIEARLLGRGEIGKLEPAPDERRQQGRSRRNSDRFAHAPGFGSLSPNPAADGKPARDRRLEGGENTARHPAGRSEEHTSELQSLMRISYAVFCLKKKKHH